MGPTNINESSVEEDDDFSSQFAALIKPIRELTKQGCWELNIADKLEEYVQYIEGLRIEVNVNGEQVKLDFCKAALVVQNSAQIYGKKVEQLWLLLQGVIEFLSSHGNDHENDEDQTPAAKLKRNHHRRLHKGDINVMADPIPLKFRKFNSKLKKKVSAKDVKQIQPLPHEILQLEEVIGSLNSVKIKLYTLSNEHLGYPSDLRSNFPFDPCNLFLKIHHANGFMGHPEAEIVHENQVDNYVTDAEPIPTVFMPQDNLDVEPPNLDDWQNDVEMASQNEIIPHDGLEENEENFNGITEKAIDRMQLRQRALAPIPVENQFTQKDPWEEMDPYFKDDDAMKKPCKGPIRCKMPLTLKKRKEVGKSPKVELVEIDEFLGKSQIIKKPTQKYCQPDNEFWEDYVHFSKTTGTAIKKQRQLRPERNIAEGIEEMDQQDINNEIDQHDNTRDDGVTFDNSGGLDVSNDNFHPEFVENLVGHTSPTTEADESKQFFEIVQQYMAEYTASAKEFVNSTESTRRVQAWHEMIQPRLREAETRRDFDIHLYGSRILEEFGLNAAIGSQCSFTKIVSDEPKFEVARYFLASLQLANTYNVEIELQNALSLDGVELKLLSRERHHEHMDDFI